MTPLAEAFRPLIYEYASAGPQAKRGRPLIGQIAMNGTQRKKRFRRKAFSTRLQDIAVLDFETDPFDNLHDDVKIFPFAACLYSDQFPPIVIWDENFANFKYKIIQAIKALPRRFTIYAHNGGRFDYMFLVSELRGGVKFKGRAIMCANIGPHELRDSFHIIPEKLADYKKDDFDYTKLTKGNRRKHKAEIIEYMTHDCQFLFEIVKDFLSRFGFKISIGQAATAKLREHYKIKRLGEASDAYMRQWFFGGRVECLGGAGLFASNRFPKGYKLFDVNSMYPAVMADRKQPIGSEFVVQSEGINDDTIFIHLRCRNFGALVRRGDNGETSASFTNGEFFTTIWEYQTATAYHLISDVQIIKCIDFRERSDFSQFVLPLYSERQLVKEHLRTLNAGAEHDRAKRDDIFLKLLMNNAYGKQAQNPRKFKDRCITDSDGAPECETERERMTWGDLPKFRNGSYAVWERPSPTFRFNNVAIAASITGAARAVLLEAIQNADDPIYCDTDSIICRDLRNVQIHKTELGAWDLEKEFDEVLIAGKKTYACKVKGLQDDAKGRTIVKSKGASLLKWDDVLAMVNGETVSWINKGPTLDRYGQQKYLRRTLSATTKPIVSNLTYHERVKQCQS